MISTLFVLLLQKLSRDSESTLLHAIISEVVQFFPKKSRCSINLETSQAKTENNALYADPKSTYCTWKNKECNEGLFALCPFTRKDYFLQRK